MMTPLFVICSSFIRDLVQVYGDVHKAISLKKKLKILATIVIKIAKLVTKPPHWAWPTLIECQLATFSSKLCSNIKRAASVTRAAFPENFPLWKVV